MNIHLIMYLRTKYKHEQNRAGFVTVLHSFKFQKPNFRSSVKLPESFSAKNSHFQPAAVPITLWFRIFLQVYGPKVGRSLVFQKFNLKKHPKAIYFWCDSIFVSLPSPFCQLSQIRKNPPPAPLRGVNLFFWKDSFLPKNS